MDEWRSIGELCRDVMLRAVLVKLETAAGMAAPVIETSYRIEGGTEGPEFAGTSAEGCAGGVPGLELETGEALSLGATSPVPTSGRTVAAGSESVNSDRRLDSAFLDAPRPQKLSRRSLVTPHLAGTFADGGGDAFGVVRDWLLAQPELGDACAPLTLSEDARSGYFDQLGLGRALGDGGLLIEATSVGRNYSLQYVRRNVRHPIPLRWLRQEGLVPVRGVRHGR